MFMRMFVAGFLLLLLLSASARPEADSAWNQLEGLHGKLEQPTPTGANSVEFRAGPKKALHAAAAAFAQRFSEDSRTPTALLWKIETADFSGSAKERRQLLQENEQDNFALGAHRSATADLRTDGEKAELENRIDNSDALQSSKELEALQDHLGDFTAAHPTDSDMVSYQLARADLLFRLDSKRATDFLQQLSTSDNPKLVSAARARLDRANLIGKPLELSFTSLDGSTSDLTGLRGKVVLVNFWASWCPDCIRELPTIKAVWLKHRDQFAILGISLDRDRQALENYIARKSIPWPQYFDGGGWQTALATKYAVHSIPENWLVDKRGVVRATAVEPQTLEEQVDHLLSE
jgi:thiol-disulfide isomerase/thioredoxin